MLVKNPKYHKRLSTKQVQLLHILFKFRFVSTDLVAELLGKDRSTIYEAFHVLEKQKLVYKFYNKTYRLRSKPATYCLDSKGIKYLRDNTNLDEKTLRNFYKNKTMDEEYIDRRLNVFVVYLKLRKIMGEKFNLYTKWGLNKEAFPSPPLPELWLERKQAASGELNYVVDIFVPMTFSWLLKRRIRQYCDFEDDSEYESNNVLFIAQNKSTEERLYKLTEDNYWDFEFYITQQDLLLSSKDGKVWIDPGESDDEYVRIKLG